MRRVIILTIFIATACGGGLPVRVTVDFLPTIPIPIDTLMNGMEAKLQSVGLLPEDSGLPELWPERLPDVSLRQVFTTEPKPIDLTPDGTEEESKSKKIFTKLLKSLQRVEINRLYIRVEKNSSTIPLPETLVQIADDKGANPDDPAAWQTIGHFPSAEPGELVDLPFEIERGGESFLQLQLTDKAKEFAVRTKSVFVYDSQEYPRRPSGQFELRLILLTTLYVDADALNRKDIAELSKAAKATAGK